MLIFGPQRQEAHSKPDTHPLISDPTSHTPSPSPHGLTAVQVEGVVGALWGKNEKWWPRRSSGLKRTKSLVT